MRDETKERGGPSDPTWSWCKLLRRACVCGGVLSLERDDERGRPKRAIARACAALGRRRIALRLGAAAGLAASALAALGIPLAIAELARREILEGYLNHA